MRTFVAAGAAVALATSGALAAKQINGNWYDKEVTKLDYDFTPSGTYMEVTGMDEKTGHCQQREKHYDSPIGPFSEEVALVFRGPLELAKVGVYYPRLDAKLKKRHAAPHLHRHGHQHFHEHNKEKRNLQQRAVGDLVTATIDGNAVTFTNEYAGGAAQATPSPSPPAEDSDEAKETEGGEGNENSDEPKETEGEKKEDKKEDKKDDKEEDKKVDTSATGGDWERTAYYCASSQTAEGIVFLNNRGKFDFTFGNGLGYASDDGSTVADSPQILKGMTLPSNTEVSIFTDKKCEGDGCGFYRPGIIAHHGFDGPEKVFLMEFSMPDDGKTGNKYENPNMPAIWMLNANIMRTGQYLSPQCTCWKSGCGEFDLFEVLDPGNFRCKSTVHAKDGIGHSDYFRRPTDKLIKAAVVFSGGKAHIKVLDDLAEFPTAFSNSDLEGLM